MTEIRAWHFVGATLRDGGPIPADGEWLRHDGPVVPWEAGLHASVQILDALLYAPWPCSKVCRVLVRGDVVDDGDAIVGRERKILWRVDAVNVLRAFARGCALDVLHLWRHPPSVREYLETGDPKKRTAALRSVTRAAARPSVKGAARDALAACGIATSNTAATSDQVRPLAWHAAWHAAKALSASQRYPAWRRTRAAQNANLESLVCEAKKSKGRS